MRAPVRVITVAGDADAEARLMRSLEETSDIEVFMRCTDRVGALGALRAGGIDAILVVSSPPWFDRAFVSEARASDVNLVGVTSDAFEAEYLLDLGCLLVGEDAEPAAIALICAAGVPGERPAPHRTGEGRLVAVWGPKGAPGRSAVAIELAYLVARFQPRTCLVDADTYGGDLLQALGVTEELPTLVWAARVATRTGVSEFAKEAGLRRVGANGPVLVPGIADPESWTEISASAWMRLLEVLRATFETSIIDVGFCIEADQTVPNTAQDGRNRLARASLAAADQVVLVLDSSATGVKHFLWSLDRVLSLCESATRIVVANRAEPARQSEIARLIGAEVGDSVLTFVPSDVTGFERARRSGRPLVETDPSSPVVRGLENVATAIGASLPRRGLLTRLGGRA